MDSYFMNKLKRICNGEKVTDTPKYIEVSPIIKKYNIHKRSLPVGLDKIVVINVTKQEAEWWVECRLKTKQYYLQDTEKYIYIYYDIVPVMASPKERSVYYNEGKITKESSDDVVEPFQEVPWISN